MKPPGRRNLAASIADRLLETCRRTGDDYQLLLAAYFCERFLYRLSQSSVSDRFALKGAMLLRLWAERPYRATRVLGQRNSRIKDFFDVQHLAEHRGFEGPTIVESVRRTFARRGTPIPEEEPVALTSAYWEDPARTVQIRAFARRSGIPVNPEVTAGILRVLRAFLLPILDEIKRGAHELSEWPARGPWRLGSD
jgi:hypothetical protein